MITVGILLTERYKLLSIAAILEVFETVNRLYNQNNKPVPFQLNLLGSTYNGSAVFPGYTYLPLNECDQQDLIFIPAFTTEDMPLTIKENSATIPFLIKQYDAGARIATVCTGAFLLAASGLLNGKAASTHVDASFAFASTFPAVILKADKTVTQDGRLYTSGGATSSFHLLLYLIREYCGDQMAIRIAKIFAIDMDRQQQTYFSTFRPSKIHNDELVAAAQRKIEDHFQETTTIEDLIKDIPSSRRNIVRRFKQVTGVTPIEYLQQTRVAAAKQLLEHSSDQMNDIIFKSGYNDPKAFRKVFKKNVGMTPSAYREKFQLR